MNDVALNGQGQEPYHLTNRGTKQTTLQCDGDAGQGQGQQPPPSQFNPNPQPGGVGVQPQPSGPGGINVQPEPGSTGGVNVQPQPGAFNPQPQVPGGINPEPEFTVQPQPNPRPEPEPGNVVNGQQPPLNPQINNPNPNSNIVQGTNNNPNAINNDVARNPPTAPEQGAGLKAASACTSMAALIVAPLLAAFVRL